MAIGKRLFEEVVALAVFVAICLAAGFLGSIFTAEAVGGWYAGLNKPDFTPPSWIFAPVWTTLYVLMGLSGWLVWRQREKGVALPLLLFTVQLALNAAWSPIFFGLKRPGWALLDIAALWLLIVLFMFASWRRSRTASTLFLPYLAWVSYASILNFFIWQMNRVAV
jgi:benzodiazapine receptor